MGIPGGLDDSKYAAAVRRIYGAAVDGLTCCGVIHRPGDGFAMVEFARVIGTITRGEWKGHPKWEPHSERAFTVPIGELDTQEPTP